MNNEIPEELLDLLMAVLLYINSKSDDKNPFVRSLDTQGEEEAYELLVKTVEAASYLYPEVEKLNKKRMELIEKEEENFILKQ